MVCGNQFEYLPCALLGGNTEIVRISCLVPYQILECRHPARVEGGFHLATPESGDEETLSKYFHKLRRN